MLTCEGSRVKVPSAVESKAANCPGVSSLCSLCPCVFLCIFSLSVGPVEGGWKHEEYMPCDHMECSVECGREAHGALKEGPRVMAHSRGLNLWLGHDIMAQQTLTG